MSLQAETYTGRSCRSSRHQLRCEAVLLHAAEIHDDVVADELKDSPSVAREARHWINMPHPHPLLEGLAIDLGPSQNRVDLDVDDAVRLQLLLSESVRSAFAREALEIRNECLHFMLRTTQPN